MDIRAKVTIYVALLGPLGVILGNLAGWGWALLPLICLAATIAVAVMIESDHNRPRLQRLFAPSRQGSLYRRVVFPIARLPRDWRMYDWALRLAVLYPIGIPVALWIYPGWAATLGGVEVMSEPEELWQQAALFCALAVLIFFW